jgi:hypothetical protein
MAMFFRSELNGIAKASVISTLPENHTHSVNEAAEMAKLAESSSGVMSYIMIVLIATTIACVIAHSGDLSLLQKAPDLDPAPVAASHP